MAASNCRRRHCGFIYSQGQCQLLTVNLNGGDELFFPPSNGNLIEMHGCIVASGNERQLKMEVPDTKFMVKG